MRIPRKSLSIDFGSKQIKIIEGKYTQDSIQVLKSMTLEIPPSVYSDGSILDKQKLTKLLKDKLEEHKIKTTVAHGVINSSQILIREIIIPKVPYDEIKSVVNYQISEYLPINLDDYVVQYVSQGNVFEGDLERIKILLMAIPKEMVLSHLDLLKSIELRPQVLDYQGNAMVKLLDFNNRLNDQYAIQNLSMASIDMGYHYSKITITKNGNIEVARTIDFGVETLHKDILSFFEYSIKEVEEKLKDIQNLNRVQDEFSDESTDKSRFANIVRSSFTEFCEKIDAIVKHYNTREIDNVLDCILLQGGLSNVLEVNQVFSSYFNIPAMQLANLDRIRFDGDLSKYGNAIGGLIRMDVR